ncbi:transmembrane protein 273 isoform X1 [Dermochelys coriacea]|uniref:transmembrane protein 273 isoform X1 n=1 Tax=Dermochelys coriacea TaxID=27794 RepID=UPI001CA7DF3B|nr:transmembrane protein 273 isoform X1 [Dermochelys coriacea]
MTFLTSWIPVLTTFLLLLYFWRAKVSASGTSEEDVIDPKYVIIGVTLGAFLAFGFLALKICMIKRQLIDNDFVGHMWNQLRSEKKSIYKNSKIQLTSSHFGMGYIQTGHLTTAVPDLCINGRPSSMGLSHQPQIQFFEKVNRVTDYRKGFIVCTT